MITLDTGVVITALIALLTLASWTGSLAQRVKGHSRAIEDNRTTSEHALERLHIENREDHQKIYDKLGEIQKDLRNSQKNGHASGA